ncbi:Inositol-pentakisphosphate 2-kinase [Teratosphaeriaceae sp. CCFEE 6253]|nr:Inositol-pentakisphosphate 2-kinase [Teratosphaeriaceae sp. CCFEE 6253]
MALVTLGDSRCKLEYLNEGGANLVFRILPKGDEPLSQRLHRKLLRLRKQPVKNAADLVEGTEQWMAILPADNLIGHELIELGPDTTTIVNNLLAGIEGRSTHRKNDSWPGSTHGVLITDMSPGRNEEFVELKPKWLVQSPTAPSNAKRCRTCALRAHRGIEKGVVTATDAQGSCPLDLVSDVRQNRRLAGERLTDISRVREYLVEEAQPLLHTLRQYQREWDPNGALSVKTDSEARDLSMAMTIRDCTLFVLVNSTGEVEARLGDLDAKGSEKLGRWQATEECLLEGGWYLGQDEICSLSRS